MGKDERIFRVTKQGYRKTSVRYASRTQVSAMFGRYMGAGGDRPDILKVEAIHPGYVLWDDVTDEFRNRPVPRCPYHTQYTGVRKPYIWSWEQGARYLRRCTCGEVYAEKHPDYPVHLADCDQKHADPAKCPCQMTKKFISDPE